MRYVLGILALGAAVVIIGYSGVTLYWTAYDSMAVEWQKQLAGAGVAAIVAWEAAALLLILHCWNDRNRFIAFGSAVLLVLAMLVTLSMELRLHVGGQADKIAEREVNKLRLEGLQRDEKTVRDRIAWLSQRESLGATTRAELDKANANLLAVKKELATVQIVGERMPQAGWASRVLGGSEQFWIDILTALPFLFWMLARVFALPLAVAGMGSLKQPATARIKEAGSLPPVSRDEPSLPILASPDRKQNTVSPVSPEDTAEDSNVIDFPLTEAAAEESDEPPFGRVKTWFDKNVEPSPGNEIRSKKLHENYSTDCEEQGLDPVHPNVFGKKLHALGLKSYRNAEGFMAYSGIKLREARDGRVAA